MPTDEGVLVVGRDAAPDDRLPLDGDRGLAGERTEGEGLRARPVEIDPARDRGGLYPPPELRLDLGVPIPGELLRLPPGVRVWDEVPLVDGRAVDRLREPAPGEWDGRRVVLGLRDPVEGNRELDDAPVLGLRVALPPKVGLGDLVVRPRAQPELRLFERDADPTLDRARGTNTLVGAVRVAPALGGDVRLPVPGGLADGLRGAAAAGVPIRLVRELPMRDAGSVLVAVVRDPFEAPLREDRLRAPMIPVVPDRPLLVAVGGRAALGTVREVLRGVVSAPILERVRGAKTLGELLPRAVGGRDPALGALPTGRDVRGLADRPRTPGFARVVGTVLDPLARWLRIVGEPTARCGGRTAGLAIAPRLPLAPCDRGTGVTVRAVLPPVADRTLVVDAARAPGFLYVVRKSLTELRKRSCWDSKDTRAVPSRKASGRFVRKERSAEPLRLAGAWTNRPWLERAGTTGTGPRIATPCPAFATRTDRGVCWTPRPKSWALTYETPRWPRALR